MGDHPQNQQSNIGGGYTPPPQFSPGGQKFVMGTTMLSDLENLNLIAKSETTTGGNRNTSVIGHQNQNQIQRNLQGAELNMHGVDEEQLSSIFSLALDEDDSEDQMPQGSSSIPPGFANMPNQHRPPPPGFGGNHQPQIMPQSQHHHPRPMRAGMQPPPNMPNPMQGAPSPNMMPPPRGWRMPPRGMPPPMGLGMMGMPPPNMNIPPPVNMQPQAIRDPYSFDVFTNPNAGGRIRLNDSVRMKGYELFNMIRIQGGAGQTGDTYTDDFYFHKFAEEKTKESRSGVKTPTISGDNADISADSIRKSNLSSRPGALLSEMMVLHSEGVKAIKPSQFDEIVSNTPLPELPGMVHMPKEFEIKRDKAAKEWHETKKVLGHAQKSNLKTPRALINVAPSVDHENKEGPENAVFTTPEWKLRRLAADVADVILEIEDVHRLLQAKVKVLNGNLSGDVADASRSVITELETKQVQMCDKLGTLLGFSSVALGPTELNEVQLRGVLWTNKGRRLICRAAGCLLPMHHAALIDAVANMMVYFVCLSPEGLESNDPLEKEKAQMDMYTAQHLALEFSTLPLDRTTECLRLFLAAQNPDSLRAVIATPGGAELIRSILMHGQKKSEQVGKNTPLAQDWSKAFAEFLKMAEEGINSSA